MSKNKPRVLILNEQCNPEWPSLPVVGYRYAKALANEVDAVVVTHIRNKPNVDRYGMGKAEVVYVDNEVVAAPLHKVATFLRGGNETGWTIQVAMDYPAYLTFEFLAWRQLRSQLESGQFDLVHRVTPMSPTLPSVMPRLTKVPFVLGPINGSLPWPKQFLDEQARERDGLSRFRSVYKLLPFARGTFAHSKAILASFQHTIDDLPESARDRAIDYPEVGFEPEMFSGTTRIPRKKKTILYVGRLVPYKLPEVVVRAFAAGKLLRSHRLVIVGSGPEESRIRSLIDEHKLGDCVELLGRKTQTEVGELMREAEIFAFPSIRELGAGVVVEAMACGMACVVVDYGGPGALVAADRGIKIPLADRDTLVTSFADALDSLVGDDERLMRLGAQAREYMLTHYTWEAKARKTTEIYDWVLGRSSEKPDFYR